MNFKISAPKILCMALISMLATNAVAAKTPSDPSEAAVKGARVTILSDQVASRRTLAEWGFAAFVEIDLPNGDTRYVLFDTGEKPETVIFNAEKAKFKGANGKEVQRVNFKDPKFKTNKIDIVISHHHDDHTRGIDKLIETYPESFGKIHIGRGALIPRYRCTKLDKPTGLDRKCLEIDMFMPDGVTLDPKKQTNVLATLADKYKDRFVVHEQYERLWPDVAGVYMTGRIPINSGEDNTGSNNFALVENPKLPAKEQEFDTLPEENALVIHTPRGLLVMSGCGHRGIVNTLRHINTNSKLNTVDTLIGGIHLLAHDYQKVLWTAKEMNKFKINTFVGSHCTGIERLIVLRKLLNLTEINSPIGSVETTFDTSKNVAIGFPSPTITSPIPELPPVLPKLPKN